MEIVQIDPKSLKENPWNPNVVDPINQEKLEKSLEKDGLQKAILIRTLPSGEKELVDGQHRTRAAIALGWNSIYCVDLGEMSDGEAKKQGLIGNSRYGDDDPMLMANLLSDSEIGSAADLLETLPFDESSLTAYFEHSSIDLDDLDALDEIDESNDLELEMPENKGRTHQVLRFKVPVNDAAKISDAITRIKHENGFTESDDLTNAGDSLVHVFSLLENNNGQKEVT